MNGALQVWQRFLLVTLDGVGNPTLITDSTVGGSGKSAYAYDEANRVTSASYWDGTSQTYTYDAAGNRASLVAGGNTTTYSYDAAGRMMAAGATPYTYDNDGNRTAAGSGKSAITYTYDQADRLLSSGGTTSATYTYSDDGLRLTKTVNRATTTYQWDPLRQSILSDGTNEYVAGGADGGSLLVQTPISGGASAAQYAIADTLGSTRLLTNASAQTQGTLAYDAFGVPKAPTSGSGTATSSLGFTGQLTDTETGFQDLRARLYDPQTGQFLQRDTAAGTAANPLSLNRYGYAAGDPTRLVDPSGRSPFGGAMGLLTSAVCGLISAATVVVDAAHFGTVVAPIIVASLPVIGPAYLLASGAAGQDLLTGRKLTSDEAHKWMALAGATLLLDAVGGGLEAATLGAAAEEALGGAEGLVALTSVLDGVDHLGEDTAAASMSREADAMNGGLAGSTLGEGPAGSVDGGGGSCGACQHDRGESSLHVIRPASVEAITDDLGCMRVLHASNTDGIQMAVQ